MIVFDVKCEILNDVRTKDSSGNNVTLVAGHYRLRGLEHLILNAAGKMLETGTDLTIVDIANERPICTLSAETLADLMSKDNLEVEI